MLSALHSDAALRAEMSVRASWSSSWIPARLPSRAVSASEVETSWVSSSDSSCCAWTSWSRWPSIAAENSPALVESDDIALLSAGTVEVRAERRSVAAPCASLTA